ncbi:MAG: hypothetical protein M1813_001238 [Trichoglossum hirsutum]|nr:MAG: hypothetical protein M1813_001238 [Trichoglossum hirsutum]
MSRLGANYRQSGQLGRNEGLRLHTLNLQKKVMGERHPDILTTVSYIATLYKHQHRLSEAEELENEVIDIGKIVLHEHHQNTIRSMTNIASTYQMQGRDDEAERLEIQVMDLRKSMLIAEHPDAHGTMNNLANSYRARRSLVNRPLRSKGKCSGEQHPDVVRSMTNLDKTRQDLQKQARLPGPSSQNLRS